MARSVDSLIVQAAVKQANKNLSKEEIKAKRQANDPNLKKKKDKEAKDKKGGLACGVLCCCC